MTRSDGGLGDVQACLAQAASGQLAGEMGGVIAGETADGVPALCRLGQAPGDH